MSRNSDPGQSNMAASPSPNDKISTGDVQATGAETLKQSLPGHPIVDRSLQNLLATLLWVESYSDLLLAIASRRATVDFDGPPAAICRLGVLLWVGLTYVDIKVTDVKGFQLPKVSLAGLPSARPLMQASWASSTVDAFAHLVHSQELVSVYLACTCAFASSFIFSLMKIFFETVGVPL